jgi:PAS domain S-box-containing protein
MKHTGLYWTLFILIMLGSFLLYSSYSEVKNSTIDQLNQQQLTLARGAARNIESFFDHYTRLLNGLSKLDSIVNADEHGKELMEVFYQSHAGEILAISRFGPDGRLMLTVPPDPRVTEVDLSGQAHFKRISETRLPVVSNVFMSARGFMAVALCAPVFGNDTFEGSISVLIPFDNLAGKYLSELKFSEDGYAWMIDSKGVELYCPVPGHVGRTVFENCRDFPSILDMAREMLQGREGQTTYVFDKVRGQTTKSGKKLAVYVPVHLPDNLWSIVIATPESEIFGIIHGLRSWWLLIAGLMIVSAALYLGRSLIISKEESKRRLIESALQKSEKKYRQLIELAREGIWVIDTGGDTTFVNPRMAEILGYTTQEMLGRPLHSFMGGQSADICVPLLELCKQGVIEEYDFEFVRKDGVPILAHMAVCPIIDDSGDYTGALVVVEDITKRKRAEEALKESQQRLADIIDFLPDATFVIDREGKIIAWNRAMEEMMGISAAEMLGKGNYEYAKPFHGEIRPILIDLVLEPCEEIEAKYLSIERKGGVLAGRSYIPDIRGCELYFSGTASALYDSRGNVVGAIESIRDVTRQQHAEDALLASQQQLADIIDFLPDATCVIDREGKIIAWNRAMEEMTGVSKKEMIGKGDHACTVPFYGDRRPHLLDLIDAPDEEIESRYQHVTRKGAILSAETYVPCIYGGEGAYVFSTGAPLFDAHGNRVGAIESIRDITAQRLAREALRRSEEKYRELVENANSIILRMDNLGNVTFINEFALRFFGYGEEEILGKNVVGTIMPPVESSERNLRLMLEDVAQDPDRCAGNIRENVRRDGAKVWIAWTNKPIRYENGRVMEVLCVGNDITERKLMEEAVARAEEKYREIFQNSVTGIFQVALDGCFLQVNAAIARIYGYDSPDEIMEGVKDLWHLFVRPERRIELNRLIETQGSVRDFEVEFFRKDKSVVWVALNTRAVHNSTGEIAYLEGTASDITDRKVLRAQLDQAQKMEAIGTLAGGIAHDFNNILTPIIGYTELSLNMISEDDRLSHNMTQVLLSANRAKDLVRQILAFSRKTEQEQKPVQVSLIAKEALRLLRSSLPTTIDIRQLIREDAVDSTTMADSTQIHQVLMNLCTNAAYAMREKGGTLSISLENVEVGPNIEGKPSDIEPGAYLMLSVADTGDGMDEAVRRRIFDPYFTTKGPNEGTGLGLAVVYGIVKSLSGAITVSSEPGKGASFSVYFPRTRTIPASPAKLPRPLPTGHGLILVVDDERFIVDMVQEMLENLGYQTVSRYNSSDALEAFRARPESFDLVITDMTMPHMTGIDLAKEIFKIRPHIPLIICTGFSEKVDENKIKLLGIKALLMKPVSMHDMAVAVSRVMGLTGQEKTVRDRRDPMAG